MATLRDYLRPGALQNPVTLNGKPLRILHSAPTTRAYYYYLHTVTKLTKRDHLDSLYLGATQSEALICLTKRGFKSGEAEDLLHGKEIKGDNRVYSACALENPIETKRTKLDPTKQTVIEFFPTPKEVLMAKETLGAIIRAARNKLALSGSATERACSMNKGHLSGIEIRSQFPSEQPFKRMCNVLKLGDPEQYYHLFPKGAPQPTRAIYMKEKAPKLSAKERKALKSVPAQKSRPVELLTAPSPTAPAPLVERVKQTELSPAKNLFLATVTQVVTAPTVSDAQVGRIHQLFNQLVMSVLLT